SGFMVELFRPDMPVTYGIEQLGVDTDQIGRSADASFEHIAHTQLAADPPRVDRLVPICKCRITRDYEHVRTTRQIGYQIISDAVGKILLVPVVAEIDKG